jgi:hypothetical protein
LIGRELLEEETKMMNCEEVQSLLLQSDLIQAPDGVFVRFAGDAALSPEHVAEHVNQCAACSQLARKLRRLEKAVRSLPQPPDSSEAKTQFVNELETIVPGFEFMQNGRAPRARGYKAHILWRIADSRLTAAAILLLVIGGSVWSYHARQLKAIAAAQAFQNLVEWNLKLTENQSPVARHKMYAESAEDVRERTVRAPFTAADRKQADVLIKNGAFLADNQDPLAEADHFSDVAELLITKMDAESNSSSQAMDKLSQTYLSVVDKGIHKNLDRAEVAGVQTPAARKQIEKLGQRNMMLQMKVEALLDKDPVAQPQLRKALDLHKRSQPVQNQKGR